MLTRDYINKVRKMMEQTGGYRMIHRDYIDSAPALPANYTPRTGEGTIQLDLVYESGNSGDMRIVNSERRR